jgi:hypothetical protein
VLKESEAEENLKKLEKFNMKNQFITKNLEEIKNKNTHVSQATQEID